MAILENLSHFGNVLIVKPLNMKKGLEKTCKKDTIKTAEQVGRL